MQGKLFQDKKDLAITLCSSIEKIIQAAKTIKSIDTKRYNTIVLEIDNLKEFFDLKHDLAIIILCFFVERRMTNSRCIISINEINNFFNCSLVDSIQINEQLDILKRNKIIKLSKQKFSQKDDYEFSLSSTVLKSILQGDRLLLNKKKEQSFIGFLNVFYEQIQNDDFEEENYDDDDLKNLMEDYEQLVEIQFLNELGLNQEELSIILYVLYRQQIYGDQKITIEKVLRTVINDSFSRYYYENQFIEKTSPLLTNNILEFTPDLFKNHLRVTSKITKGLNLNDNHSKNSYTPSSLVNIIMPEQIKIQEMVYPDDLNISFLDKLISNEGYFDAIEKLKAEEIEHKQIVCILYGLSGTGKSQTIRNLAAKYNRPILQVSLSQIIDPFVGMTERNMSECFQNYKQAVKHFEVYKEKKGKKYGPVGGTPILFIDEFESLVPKRSESGPSSSVQNMFSNLVNVFLTEIESLPSGIVLLCSNLPNAMDVALHRRINFKFSFGKFSKEAQVKTLKIYFKEFKENVFYEIVENHDLTPGNIFNIKKAYILETLFNQPENENEKLTILKHLTERELILNNINNRNTIGFKKY